MKARLQETGARDGRIPGEGPLGVTVPGAVRGWWDLHQRFGAMPWDALFEQAIDYAENGHPVAQAPRMDTPRQVVNR